MSERFSIEPENVAAVMAYSFTAAPKKRLGVTFVFGHGAGAGQTSPWIVSYAEGLASRGVDVVTFNFPYMEQGRRVPDRPQALEACFRAALAAATERHPSSAVAAGGKSMGGRIASQVAAALDEGGARELCALVFLGYPLHPPGKPQQLRSAHLSQIRVPMLFVQGSRDVFGTPAELSPIVRDLAPLATLQVVEGGDHSLVSTKNPKAREEAHGVIQDGMVGWIRNQEVGGRR